MWIQLIVYTHTNAITQNPTQAGARLLLWCPSFQVVLLLPGTCHRGDGWLHHQCSPEGNGTLKESNNLSILSSAFFSDDHLPLLFFFFLFVLITPLCPFTLPFISPSMPSLSSKTVKMKGGENMTDLLFQISLRMSLTPQSTRYYCGFPTDLNPNLKSRIWVRLLWWCLAVGAEGNSVPFSV